jgi:hypothetical protein
MKVYIYSCNYTCESVYGTLFSMTPSIATKFQYVNSLFLFSSHSLHVSAPAGHLQVRIYN